MNEEIGHLLTVLTTVILIILSIVVFGWLYEANQYNSFNQAAQQVITRHNGVDNDAQTQLNDLSHDKYHGMFKVKPDSDADKKVDYGKTIYYTTEVRLPSVSSQWKSIVAKNTSSTTASVRPDSND